MVINKNLFLKSLLGPFKNKNKIIKKFNPKILVKFPKFRLKNKLTILLKNSLILEKFDL